MRLYELIEKLSQYPLDALVNDWEKMFLVWDNPETGETHIYNNEKEEANGVPSL